MKHLSKKILALLFSLLIITTMFTACTEAPWQQTQLTETQSSEMYRLTVYNSEEEIMFEAEGDLEWTKTNDNKTLVVTCKIGPNSYKEATINNWSVFTIENITGIYGEYHNKMVFHSETLSDIETNPA